MIRVNLAKKGVAKKSGMAAFSGGGGAASNDLSGMDELSLGAENPGRVLIIRLAVIFMGVFALIAYEQTNVPPLKNRANQIRRQLAEVKKKNKDNENVVQENARFEKEQDVLQGQINAIEAIKKDRLREVRVLDYIQREIPEKVWLQKLDLAEGKLMITGYATADIEMTTFMEGLQRSAYLKDILLVRSTETVLQDIGTVKKFEISCSMERTL